MPTEPGSEPVEPATTGSFVVTFRDGCTPDTAARHVDAVIGTAAARSRDHAGQMKGLTSALLDRGAAVFDDFGMAIIDPVGCGIDPALVEAMVDTDDVLHVRPEARLRALGFWDGLRRLFTRSPRERSERETEPASPDEPRDRAGLAVEASREARSGEVADPRDRAGFAVVPAPTPIVDADELTWGLRALRIEATPFSGRGIGVAVLDTGFDFGHPDFEGRRIVAESFVAGLPVQDGSGHGTHVAGVVAGPREPSGAPRYGVAPDVALHVGKVLSDDGLGREGDILAGILWALEHGCAIISMSLGGRALPDYAIYDYERIGRVTLARGTLIVSAAGNGSARARGVLHPVATPANARSILAVGAVDEALTVADFSNAGLDPDGGAVDIAGPGVDVLSAVPGPERHAAFAGTSMATPHVSGVAALLAESNPALRGAALWEALARTARALPLPARDVGVGLVQAPVGDILG